MEYLFPEKINREKLFKGYTEIEMLAFLGAGLGIFVLVLFVTVKALLLSIPVIICAMLLHRNTYNNTNFYSYISKRVEYTSQTRIYLTREKEMKGENGSK